MRGPTASVLASLPLGERWALFVRGGILFAKAEAHHFLRLRSTSAPPPDRSFSDEVFFGGAGVEWAFVPRLAARLEYQLVDELQYDSAGLGPGRVLEDHKDSMDVLSLGIAYQF